MKIVYRVLKGLVVVAACLLVVIVLVARLSGGEPAILGHQIKTVLSGSMEPVFQTGSVIAIQLAKDSVSYEKGDIITFRIEDKLITHRITEAVENNGQVLYRTKGDNNDAADLWTVPAENVVGKYVDFTIPYAGYAMNIAQSKSGTALLLFVPGLLLLVSAIRSIIVAAKELEIKKLDTKG
ncbi:signal peptidase I SipW [Bacillus tianshenii]|nr:signal peptidase I [Bacillus tianshenii]